MSNREYRIVQHTDYDRYAQLSRIYYTVEYRPTDFWGKLFSFGWNTIMTREYAYEPEYDLEFSTFEEADKYVLRIKNGKLPCSSEKKYFDVN